jgi:hypothetical protein
MVMGGKLLDAAEGDEILVFLDLTIVVNPIV